MFVIPSAIPLTAFTGGSEMRGVARNIMHGLLGVGAILMALGLAYQMEYLAGQLKVGPTGFVTVSMTGSAYTSIGYIVLACVMLATVIATMLTSARTLIAIGGSILIVGVGFNAALPDSLSTSWTSMLIVVGAGLVGAIAHSQFGLFRRRPITARFSDADTLGSDHEMEEARSSGRRGYR